MSDEPGSSTLSPEAQAIIDFCLASIDFPELGGPRLLENDFPRRLQKRLIEAQNSEQIRTVQLFAAFLRERHGPSDASRALLFASTLKVDPSRKAKEADAKLKAYFSQFGSGDSLKAAPELGKARPKGTIQAHTLMQPFRKPGR